MLKILTLGITDVSRIIDRRILINLTVYVICHRELWYRSYFNYSVGRMRLPRLWRQNFNSRLHGLGEICRQFYLYVCIRYFVRFFGIVYTREKDKRVLFARF